MSFASPLFLWFFMPATLLAYLLFPPRHRNAVVAVASLIFYAWGAGTHTPLLLSAIAVNYGAGLALGGARLRGRPRARRGQSALRNRAAMGAATAPPPPPCRTNTAKATESR
ncbi:hypothetical protein [Streptosporangium sandarakinum]|uniref:D-alanyl-lipoteichoic acid acyltransferase DltB (MBOAT superfamily) n=1 Tax=Streptosporangium sandarakinum TaxID=1260955 RepID=A0A852UQZ0_9ACTN|nr:hypothetical protein [Streptosporangium sandarakinum]NYF38048.1 D-alanyl-lipoteichoic acid acyltransferase DltB (MBOAT superfamily) [Streptosporangium sandarakinum]